MIRALKPRATALVVLDKRRKRGSGYLDADEDLNCRGHEVGAAPAKATK